MPRRHQVFPAGTYYHVCNRGVNKGQIFFDARDYQRALDLLDYYRYAHPPVRFSFLIDLPADRQREIWEALRRSGDCLVTILAFCFLSNHYHLLLKGESDQGIVRFLLRWQDSLAKYVNIRYERSGPLFQGPFRAVHVGSDQQLLHLSRYIHLNPLTAKIVTNRAALLAYPWSSLGAYIGREAEQLCTPDLVLSFFKSSSDYQSFVFNRASYQESLEGIKDLTLE